MPGNVTAFGVNDPLSNKLWAKKLNVEALKPTYFGKFMGEESSNMIQVQTDFEVSAGSEVTIGLRVKLKGDGVTEGQTQQGNEESLTTYNDKVMINELSHAVRTKGKNSIDAQRVPFKLRNEAKEGLQDWYAERFDVCMANHLAGNSLVTDMRYAGNNVITAPTNIIYAKGLASEAAVNADATALFDLKYIDYAAEKANTMSPLIRPIMVNGKKKFVMFLHDYQVTDMRTNTSEGQWLDIQKAALAGGIASKSPIYNDALGEYNNVILHKWNALPSGLAADGSAAANTRRAVLCGAQAASVGFGKEFSKGSHYKWVEELFDYERELGVSAQTVWGIKKSKFNGADFGTVVVTTYAKAHA